MNTSTVSGRADPALDLRPDTPTRPRRWPACALAVLLLAYAAGKAVFAAQGRLGLPTGPVVSAAEHDAYFLDIAAAQWSASATGVLGACLALATVTPLARRIPRAPMLLALAGMLLGIGAGAAIMMVDGFGGPGPGWQWYHGLVGTAAIGLLLATFRGYAVRTRRAQATTPSISHRPPTSTRAAAYGAAAWAAGFAAVNVYLQIVGVDGVQQNWAAFTAVNLGVVGLKLFGAAVALATVQRWGSRVPRWLVTVCVWGAAAMLLLYATAGLVSAAAGGELAAWMLAGGTFRVPVLAYLGFFAVGGTLFAVTARTHQQRTATSPRWALVGLLGAPLLLAVVLFTTYLVF